MGYNQHWPTINGDLLGIMGISWEYHGIYQQQWFGYPSVIKPGWEMSDQNGAFWENEHVWISGG